MPTLSIVTIGAEMCHAPIKIDQIKVRKCKICEGLGVAKVCHECNGAGEVETETEYNTSAADARSAGSQISCIIMLMRTAMRMRCGTRWTQLPLTFCSGQKLEQKPDMIATKEQGDRA